MTYEEKLYAELRRIGKEPSRAMEKRFYGDPSNVVEFQRGGPMQREIDEVELLLDLWADWMRRPEPLADGYPEKASGGFIESWRKDDEDEEECRLAERISRINAAFDSLQTIHKDAILKHYGLGSRVWRFAKDASFEDAKIVARVKFVTKGLL